MRARKSIHIVEYSYEIVNDALGERSLAPRRRSRGERRIAARRKEEEERKREGKRQKKGEK